MDAHMQDWRDDPRWAAPLPDLSRPGLAQRVRIGGREFQLQFSRVARDPVGEQGSDLVQFWVLYQGRPLALDDLGVGEPLCSNLWTYFCGKVIEAAVDFYAPRPLPGGEPNPRLGCWGYRPDLAEEGLATDCGLALVMGVSVSREGTSPLGDERAYLRRLRDAVAESLAYWMLEGVKQQASG